LPLADMKAVAAAGGSTLGGKLRQAIGEPKQVSVGGVSLFGTGRQIVVPPLNGPTRFSCIVTATVGSDHGYAESAKFPIKPDPPALRGPGPGFLHQIPPSIPAKLGVGGTATCFPGVWGGTPTFTYAWYALSGINAKTFRSSSQSYVPTVKDEGLSLQCRVTATNIAGSASAESQPGEVAVAAAIPKDDPTIHFDARSPDSTGLVTKAGTGVIAEQVVLECRPADWNRTDLTSSYQWFMTDSAGKVIAGPEQGRLLTLDMRPGELQYNLHVRCQQTVKTSTGATSQAMSPEFWVWNGCTEQWTNKDKEVGSNSAPVGPFPLLDTWRWGPSGALARHGLFGLSGDGLGGNSVDSAFWRATTDGPNCLDYQKYLLGQGFDVKQWPTSPADWILKP
jgi:hypothetical protein